MKLYKKEEHYKDPVKTAKRNFFALGFLYIILGVFLLPIQPVMGYTLLPLGVLLLIVAFLLGKKNVYGIYLGWLFVAFGSIVAFLSGALVSLLIVAYIAFWNYKAGQVLKSTSTSESVIEN